MTDHERWMEFAFKEAEHAYKRKEVPVGAVVVHENRIIGRGYNQTETLRDPTAHAEIIAITAAARLAIHAGQPVSTLLWSFSPRAPNIPGDACLPRNTLHFASRALPVPIRSLHFSSSSSIFRTFPAASKP